MLLVHPVREVGRYIPVLIASVIIGTRSDNPGWGLIALAIIVVFAIARWFTTTYRIGTDNVELRTGVLQRKRLAVPRSRIRSVDIQADPLHRVLGLSVLSIGTGQQAERDEQFKLDALDARLVPELRTELLRHLKDVEGAGTAERPGTASADEGAAAETEARSEGVEIGHWQPKWVRYAPLSLTGFAIVAPAVGLAFQYGLAEAVFRSDTVHTVQGRGALFLTAVVAALVAAVIAIVSLAGCARYLATYHRLRVLDNGRTLHLRHGLFTTRQTTLDLARLRGATVNEPLLLRLAGGAELEAIMTGTSPRQKILPQAPRAAVDRTLGHLLAGRPNRADTTIATETRTTTRRPDRRTPVAAPTENDDNSTRPNTAIETDGRNTESRSDSGLSGQDRETAARVTTEGPRSGPNQHSLSGQGPETAARVTTEGPRSGPNQHSPSGQGPETAAGVTTDGPRDTAAPAKAPHVPNEPRSAGSSATSPAVVDEAGDAAAPESIPLAADEPREDAAPAAAPLGPDGPREDTMPATNPGGADDSGDAAAPATIPLVAHGSRARRRRYTRALGPVAAVTVALGVASVAGVPVPPWAWILLALIALAAAGLAHDRYSGLGHAVLPAVGNRPTWLITRSGSLDRDRDCLEAPGVIGWTVRQTFFQRRAGLATLVAATAAGKKRYHVVDVPVDRAWELIEAVTPGQTGHRPATIPSP
ncbi:PH domain-containing protein [Nocardia sp. BMG51109]|uniref:PH domain-containing protein n=1 Tax=Nocardia sp. BMG51109 TaxID=1056816 RepID=UPI0035108F78